MADIVNKYNSKVEHTWDKKFENNGYFLITPRMYLSSTRIHVFIWFQRHTGEISAALIGNLMDFIHKVEYPYDGSEPL